MKLGLCNENLLMQKLVGSVFFCSVEFYCFLKLSVC